MVASLEIYFSKVAALRSTVTTTSRLPSLVDGSTWWEHLCLLRTQNAHATLCLNYYFATYKPRVHVANNLVMGGEP